MASSNAALYQHVCVSAQHPAEHNTAFSWTKGRINIRESFDFLTSAYFLWPHSDLLTNQIWKKHQRSTSQPVVGCFFLTEILVAYLFLSPQTPHYPSLTKGIDENETSAFRNDQTTPIVARLRSSPEYNIVAQVPVMLVVNVIFRSSVWFCISHVRYF